MSVSLSFSHYTLCLDTHSKIKSVEAASSLSIQLKSMSHELETGYLYQCVKNPISIMHTQSEAVPSCCRSSHCVAVRG